VTVESNGAKHKVFWDEVRAVIPVALHHHLAGGHEYLFWNRTLKECVFRRSSTSRARAGVAGLAWARPPLRTR